MSNLVVVLCMGLLHWLSSMNAMLPVCRTQNMASRKAMLWPLAHLYRSRRNLILCCGVGFMAVRRDEADVDRAQNTVRLNKMNWP